MRVHVCVSERAAHQSPVSDVPADVYGAGGQGAGLGEGGARQGGAGHILQPHPPRAHAQQLPALQPGAARHGALHAQHDTTVSSPITRLTPFQKTIWWIKGPLTWLHAPALYSAQRCMLQVCRVGGAWE